MIFQKHIMENFQRICFLNLRIWEACEIFRQGGSFLPAVASEQAWLGIMSCPNIMASHMTVQKMTVAQIQVWVETSIISAVASLDITDPQNLDYGLWSFGVLFCFKSINEEHHRMGGGYLSLLRTMLRKEGSWFETQCRQEHGSYSAMRRCYNNFGAMLRFQGTKPSTADSPVMSWDGLQSTIPPHPPPWPWKGQSK